MSHWRHSASASDRRLWTAVPYAKPHTSITLVCMARDLREEEALTRSSGEEGSYLRRTQGPARRSLVGQTLGDRYRVIDFIARGGMGTVYLAEQLGLRRKVALKVLDVRPSDEGAESQEFRARFEKEASLAAGIAHPHVVVVHDFGQTDEELCYLAMEYLEGRTVQRAVEESGPLAVGRIVHIALQACAALGAAHAAGLIHRDLKPSNLILLQRGQDADFVKLVDFGLVKQVVPRGDEPKPIGIVTKPGTLLGSPAFISPEQILANAVTPATDLYSLGAVMFFMATGLPPFRGRSEYEIIRAHVERQPPALRDVAPECEVPAELESIIRRCLAKKTHERFASVEDLATALEACESITLPDLGPRRLIPTSSRPPAPQPPVGSSPSAPAEVPNEPKASTTAPHPRDASTPLARAPAPWSRVAGRAAPRGRGRRSSRSGGPVGAKLGVGDARRGIARGTGGARGSSPSQGDGTACTDSRRGHRSLARNHESSGSDRPVPGARPGPNASRPLTQPAGRTVDSRFRARGSRAATPPRQP